MRTRDTALIHDAASSRDDGWLRTFLIIFSGQAFSLLGSSAVNFALVWWLTATTGSASILAYASIAGLMPQAVIGPVAGPFIDRWDRRITMMVVDLCIAATSLGLIAVFALGRASVGAIIAIVALRSLGSGFHTPASQAAVPMYVPQDQLMRVAGWNFFLGSGVAMAGPVLGAFLMGVAPMTAVLSVDIAGAVIAVVTLLLVRIPHPQRPQGDAVAEGLFGEFAEGWRELVRHRALFYLTMVLTVVTLLYMPLNALFPLMTLEHFGGGALGASVVELAFGGGMLVGSVLIGGLSSRVRPVRLIGVGIVCEGALLAGSGLLPSSGFWVFVGLCAFMGVSVPLFAAPLTALFQTLVEPSRLGRVLSLYTTVSLLVAAPGLLLAGPLAERTGVAPWFALSGTLILLSGLFVWAPRAVRHLSVTRAAS
jgi:DHA3 family macrolide efflux protein-like MFS transporter